jgi:hypothetical protein
MLAPTPQQMFGFGSVPLTSYFNKTAGSSANTMFSPAARVMLQQEEEMQRQQEAEMRRQQAEQIANQILGQAPDMTEEQLNETIMRTPAVFGGGVQGLEGHRRFRQQVAPSQADERLGPLFLSRIKDPSHARRFQQRMLEEGYSANDAWEAYRDEEKANTDAAIALAEAGVPQNEFPMFFVNGVADPVAVARRVTEAKKATARTNDPIDQELDLLKGAMDQMKAVIGDEEEMRKDARFRSYAQRYQQLVDAKMAKLAPATGGAPTPAAKPSAFLQKLQGVTSIPVKKP